MAETVFSTKFAYTGRHWRRVAWLETIIVYRRNGEKEKQLKKLLTGLAIALLLMALTACLDLINTYTLTYDANGADSGTVPAPQVQTRGEYVEMAMNTGNLAKAGYEFGGWSESADGSDHLYTAGETYDIDQVFDLTLYAYWTHFYQVTFDANQATGGTVPDSSQVMSEALYELPLNSGGLIRDGYTFMGWNTKADGTDFTYAVGQSVNVTAAITYYASWGQHYESATIGTLICVPRGRFQRDSGAENISVISNPYRISRYEITRAQFLDVVGGDPSDTAASSGDSDPVQRTNLYHIITFCNKLSLREGLTPVYAVSGINFSTLAYASIPTADNTTWNSAVVNWAANGYRLPSEMEWMWAAMGATHGFGFSGLAYTSGYARAFAGSTGSNAIGDYVWYGENSTTTTHPVGGKLANELGLHDMSGNVYEYCWDRSSSDADNPGYTMTGWLHDYHGDTSTTNRVMRSGCFSSSVSSVTIAERGFPGAYSMLNVLGFRVARN